MTKDDQPFDAGKTVDPIPPRRGAPDSRLRPDEEPGSPPRTEAPGRFPVVLPASAILAVGMVVSAWILRPPPAVPPAQPFPPPSVAEGDDALEERLTARILASDELKRLIDERAGTDKGSQPLQAKVAAIKGIEITNIEWLPRPAEEYGFNPSIIRIHFRNNSGKTIEYINFLYGFYSDDREAPWEESIAISRIPGGVEDRGEATVEKKILPSDEEKIPESRTIRIRIYPLAASWMDGKVVELKRFEARANLQPAEHIMQRKP